MFCPESSFGLDLSTRWVEQELRKRREANVGNLREPRARSPYWWGRTEDVTAIDGIDVVGAEATMASKSRAGRPVLVAVQD